MLLINVPRLTQLQKATFFLLQNLSKESTAFYLEEATAVTILTQGRMLFSCQTHASTAPNLLLHETTWML